MALTGPDPARLIFAKSPARLQVRGKIDCATLYVQAHGAAPFVATHALRDPDGYVVVIASPDDGCGP